MRVCARMRAIACLQDMLGADDKNFGHKRCKVPAQVLASLATWEKARGEVDKAIATAAVALEFTQNNELSLDLFEGWIQDLRTVRFGSQLEKMSTATETRQAGGEEHVLQERMEAESLRDTDDKGGTVLVHLILTVLRDVAPEVFEGTNWIFLLNSSEEMPSADFGKLCRDRIPSAALAALEHNTSANRWTSST